MKTWYLMILLLLVGCGGGTSGSPLSECQPYCDSVNTVANNRLSDCMGELSNFSRQMYDIQNSPVSIEKAIEDCQLIVTDGQKPFYPSREIMDIRTLNIQTNEIKGRYDDSGSNWSYWLACETK